MDRPDCWVLAQTQRERERDRETVRHREMLRETQAAFNCTFVVVC